MGTAFVTGANGFLGGTLIRELLAAGWQVRALLRPGANDLLLREPWLLAHTAAGSRSGDRLERIGDRLERVKGDLLQPESYRSALTGCDALFHTAASYTHDSARLAEMEAVNSEGARRVLTTALTAGVARLVHTSTIGTIGQPGGGDLANGILANEETAFNLPNPTAYVRSKLAGEQIALELAQTGAPIMIVHPAAMLGPGDWRPTASGRRFLDVLQGKGLRYPTGGINWAPVSDVARGLILTAERGRPGRRYLLGHREGNLDRDAFVHLVRQAAGEVTQSAAPSRWAAGDGLVHSLWTRRRWLLRWRDKPQTLAEAQGTAPSSPVRLTCDPTRAIVELGMPQSSLLAAAQAEYAWYRQNGYI